MMFKRKTPAKRAPHDPERVRVGEALIALDGAFELAGRKLGVLATEQATTLNELVAALQAVQRAIREDK